MGSFQLNGKTALVTGASSGLGVTFARLLAEAGSSLILVARRRERLQELSQELHDRYGAEARWIALDLTEENAPRQLYDQLSRDGVRVDILINNAGFGLFGMFVEIDWERERKMLELDMVALTHLTKLFGRDMVDRGEGRILQIASVGAYQPAPTYASYSAAKAYVLSFGEAINYELKGSGVRCTVLSPGVTRTEFHDVAGQDSLTLYQRLTMMKPEKVCTIGLKAMLRGAPSVLPGFVNKLSAVLVKLMPRRWVTATAYRMMTIGAKQG